MIKVKEGDRINIVSQKYHPLEENGPPIHLSLINPSHIHEMVFIQSSTMRIKLRQP
jgi:hypothetical protein